MLMGVIFAQKAHIVHLEAINQYLAQLVLIQRMKEVHQLKNVFHAKLILTVIYQVKVDANNVDQHLKHSEEQLLVNV